MPKIKLLIALTKRKAMFEKIKSRKLWLTVLAATVGAFGEGLGLSPDIIKWVIGALSVGVLSQGIADHGEQGKAQSAFVKAERERIEAEAESNREEL